MEAKCECGKPLKQLYWSKFIEVDNHSKVIAIEDYFYCPWCNLVYQREIQTNVLWHKVQGLATTMRGQEDEE